MSKKFLNTEFKEMSNEQLCAIAARLKFQLVEARFKISTGEIMKISVVNQIRKTIAKIFTELTNRGYKISIGSHGVSLYDLKTNKPQTIDTKKIQQLVKENKTSLLDNFKDDEEKKSSVKPTNNQQTQVSSKKDVANKDVTIKEVKK